MPANIIDTMTYIVNRQILNLTVVILCIMHSPSTIFGTYLSLKF